MFNHISTVYEVASVCAFFISNLTLFLYATLTYSNILIKKICKFFIVFFNHADIQLNFCINEQMEL